MGDNPMLKFVGTGQDYPVKREAQERAHDFGEISKSFGHSVINKAEEMIKTHLTSDDRERFKKEFSSQVEVLR